LNLRKFLTAAALGFAVLGVAAAPAIATNPHHEEQDGCDHGATSKPCKDDPQPEHGKDCEVHGNHGGINEDHCEVTSSTTTTEPPTTTTTSARTPDPTSSTTTTTLVESPSPTTTTLPSSPTTTTAPPADVPPSLGCMTPDGYPYVTNIEQGGCSAPDVAPTTPTGVFCPDGSTFNAERWSCLAGLDDYYGTAPLPAASELAHTGSDWGIVAMVGAGLIFLGYLARLASKR